MSLLMAPPPSSLDDYDLVCKCGEGTYGCVYKALHKKTGQLVALKKVRNNVPKEDGCPVEVKYLTQLLSQKNVVNLRDHFWSKDGQLCLVFEYMEFDLWRLMTGPSISFAPLQIKCLLKQMLEGLHQCHSAGIMHRDIKPSNLLINAQGVLKLADFGLTTSFRSSNYLSNNVVSLYYRSPELLMGSHYYGPEIDMWSVGCIFIELMTNNYLFAGATEAEQLDLIFRVFGTPTEEVWPGVTGLPGWASIENKKAYPLQDLATMFDFLERDAFDLASKLLTLDPKKRITSYEALQHPWFTSNPLPCPPHRLPNNWNLNATVAGRSRKYQSDFPRTRQLCKDIVDFPPLPVKKTSATRGRKAATTRTTVRAAPYTRKPVAVAVGTAKCPIVIAD